MTGQGKTVRRGTNSRSEDAPSKSKREIKREAIIAAAKDMFFTQGYSGVSMDDIVARVSGSKATLYSHFPSKDQLLMALVEKATVGAVSEALRPDSREDFPAFLRNYGRVAMQWRTSADIIGLERLAASEALRFPEFGRTCYEQGVLPNRKLAADVFGAAMDTGILRKTDPLRATDQFMSMCAGWMWRLQIWGVTGTPSASAIKTNVDAAVETFIHGYATSGARREEKQANSLGGTRAMSAPTLPDRSPGKSRRDQKREDIVAAAKELFFSDGYADVSMNRIVERVGGSKATLYSHFASKQALLLAVMYATDDEPALSAAPTGDARAFRKWLVGYGRLAANRLMSHDSVGLQRLAAGEAVQLPEVGKSLYEAGVVPAFAQFVSNIRDAMEKGLLRRAPARLAAEQFVEMCTGGRLRRVIWGIAAPPSETEVNEQVDAASKTFMDGNGTAMLGAAAAAR